MWSWYAPVGQTNDDQVSGLADHVAVGNTPRALLAVGDRLSAAADDNPMALLVRGFVIPEGRYRGVANFEGIPGGYDR